MINIFAKKKILLVTLTLSLLAVAISGYCLFQFNHYTQNKFDGTDIELTRLSDWLASKEAPEIFTVDENEGVFSFYHIGEDTDFGVGWTRILQNEEIKNSLGFYTNYIDPILTPLTADTLIGSAWQWPQDSKLYNGPFFNYYLNFRTRKTIELSTKGRLVAKSKDRQKAVFLESACVKERLQADQLASCNNLDLSLRVIDLMSDLNGIMINHYYAMNQWFDQGPPYVGFLDFGKVVFSPDSKKLAIEIKIEETDYDTLNEYWTLFIADTETGEIIKRNNRLSKNRYQQVFWLNNENIIYW